MPGDTVLQSEEAPPGKERPYLLDPCAPINPIEHIRFVPHPAIPRDPSRQHGSMQWFARPRDKSQYGSWTIRVCGLNDPDLMELRKDHIDHWVRPQANELLVAISTSAEQGVRRQFQRALGMLDPRSMYVALTYDALRHFVPDTALVPWNLSWPQPRDVGLPGSLSSPRTGQP